MQHQGIWLHPMLLFFAGILFLVHLAILARAITRPGRTAASRAAWVAVIVLLPIFGSVAYLLLGETSIGRPRLLRMREAVKALSRPVPDATVKTADSDALGQPDRDGDGSNLDGLVDLCSSVNGFPLQPGNRIVLLGDPAAPPDQPTHDSDAAIASLVEAINDARDHVHISFYIWLDDNNGGKVADAVAAAAKRGVKCRVMADAIGSVLFIRGPRWKQLREAGVDLVETLYDIPRIGKLAVGRIDLRNHRKLVVVDNAIAFCGSQNCADPAFRTEPHFAPWIDIFLRCEGPVARQAQWLFLTAWLSEGKQAPTDLPAALPAPAADPAGSSAVMYGTGPATREDAMSDSFVGAIYAAQRDLLITSPYFAPDEALLRALCAAPRRGVRTTIIFPKRNNSKLVALASQAAYLQMLEAGVAIHEYPLGLLHTKSLTADGRFALVGSANMDRRSLQLNFENNLLVIDQATTAAVRSRQLGYLSVCGQVTLAEARAQPWHMRLVQNIAAMAAPVI